MVGQAQAGRYKVGDDMKTEQEIRDEINRIDEEIAERLSTANNLIQEGRKGRGATENEIIGGLMVRSVQLEWVLA